MGPVTQERDGRRKTPAAPASVPGHPGALQSADGDTGQAGPPAGNGASSSPTPGSVGHSLGVTVGTPVRVPTAPCTGSRLVRHNAARAIPRLVCLPRCSAGQAAAWDWRFPCQVPPAAAGAARAVALARVPAPVPAAATAVVAAGVPAAVPAALGVVRGAAPAAAEAAVAALAAGSVAVPLVRAAPVPAVRVRRALGVHGTDLRASGDDSQPGPCLPRPRRRWPSWWRCC